jgi:TPR repeat protein
MDLKRGSVISLLHILLVSAPMICSGESKDKADHVADFFETYKSGAAAGVASDQYNLGASYRWGIGVPRDTALAAQWIRKSAEKGYPIAERTLGEMLEAGEGIPINNDEALQWYKRAAKLGDPLAQKDYDTLKIKIQK